jgi:two-component system, OmpR family, sensor histidine kinase KdpD
VVVPLGFVHDRLSLVTPALLLVLPVLLAAVLGGRDASIAVAAIAALAFNVIFIPPVFTLQIHHPDDVVALVVFMTVALVGGGLVTRESELRRVAEQGAAEVARAHAALVELTNEREHLAVEAQRIAVLEEVDLQKSALLRAVSHDLHTPLVTIRVASTDLLSGELSGTATRKELVELVIFEVERLDRIVTNLLSFSRIDAGALEPTLDIVDVDEAIEHCVRRLSRVYPGSTFDVDVDPELPLVHADPVLVDQVLTNLLDNAVTHGGRHVRITAVTGRRTARGAADPSDHRWVEVTVGDDGPGLGSIDRAQLFEPWNHVGHGIHSGVGLAICRSVVEAHGGMIAADDNPDGGAWFTFTLPVYTDAQPA